MIPPTRIFIIRISLYSGLSLRENASPVDKMSPTCSHPQVFDVLIDSSEYGLGPIINAKFESCQSQATPDPAFDHDGGWIRLRISEGKEDLAHQGHDDGSRDRRVPETSLHEFAMKAVTLISKDSNLELRARRGPLLEYQKSVIVALDCPEAYGLEGEEDERELDCPAAYGLEEEEDEREDLNVEYRISLPSSNNEGEDTRITKAVYTILKILGSHMPVPESL